MSDQKSTGAGKGDKDRSTHSKKYKDNYDLIVWKKKSENNIDEQRKK
jgi:hypothetical protein